MKIECSYCSTELKTDKTILKCPNCNGIVICPSSIHKMPHEILKEIVDACGVPFFFDTKRLQGALADITQNKQIRRIILLAVNDNIHGKLKNSTNSDSTIRLESLKYIFATQNLLYREVADYIVDSFAYSLGIIEYVNNVDLSKINNWFTDNSDKKSFSIYEKVEPARILDFSLKDKFVFENQPFIIHWEATNFTRAYINNEEIPISKNEYETKISGYKKFVLTVENEHYKDDTAKPIEIQPIKIPQIRDFKASKTHIKSNEEVILSWQVNDAIRVTIKDNNQEIDVTQKNDFTLAPTNTIEYELIVYAINDLYSTSKRIKITVVKPVEIQSFEANKKRIVESDKIILSWQVANAKNVLLLPLQKDVTKLKQIELLPTQTTTYTLQVSNEVFTKEKDESVFVHLLPVVDKIPFPKMPTFDIPLPNLSFDTSYKQSITRQMENAAWYNKLFSLQFNGVYSLINNILQDINKRMFKILTQIKNG